MEDYLGIHDPDGRVLTFKVHPAENMCYTYIFGNYNNNLEIRIECGTHRIVDIESIYIGNL